MTKPTGNPRGRPPAKKLAEVAKKPVGRPRTDVQNIVNEYRDRMLASPKSVKVLEKVFEVALEDGHPHQLGAMKLVIDRIAPVSAFDVSKGASGSMPQITINVSGLSSPTVQTLDDVIDVEDTNG
jgi:hypothetical protein